MHLNREVSILLVEDDDIDAEAVARGLQQARVANPIVRARNGEEALAILREKDGALGIGRPYLVLPRGITGRSGVDPGCGHGADHLER